MCVLSVCVCKTCDLINLILIFNKQWQQSCFTSHKQMLVCVFLKIFLYIQKFGNCEWAKHCERETRKWSARLTASETKTNICRKLLMLEIHIQKERGDRRRCPILSKELLKLQQKADCFNRTNLMGPNQQARGWDEGWVEKRGAARSRVDVWLQTLLCLRTFFSFLFSPPRSSLQTEQGNSNE